MFLEVEGGKRCVTLRCVTLIVSVILLLLTSRSIGQSTSEGTSGTNSDSSSVITIRTTELDSLLNRAIDLKADFAIYRLNASYSIYSLSSLNALNEWKVERLMKERGGLLSDPRLWFIFGATVGLLADGN
jgi:hypothetical protein